MKRKSWMWIMAILAGAVLLVAPAAFAADQTPAAPAAPAAVAPPAAPAPAAAVPMKPAMAKAAAEKMTVTGTITETKNAKGKIVAYNLMTEQGEKYVLSSRGKGKHLRKMLGKKVEAIGTVRETKGKKIMHVTSYKEVM
jgi:hypothetical protein